MIAPIHLWWITLISGVVLGVVLEHLARWCWRQFDLHLRGPRYLKKYVGQSAGSATKAACSTSETPAQDPGHHGS